MKTNNNNSYRKKLFFIALPIMLSNMISQVEMLIDKIFLGRLDIIYMSAVGNATTPMWTTMDVLFTLTTGATIMISQAIGKGDKKRAYELTCSMYKYSSTLAIILFIFWMTCARVVFTLMGVKGDVLDYATQYAKIFAPVFLTIGIGASISSMLQNSERTSALLVYGIVRSVLNVVLDWAMIFGNLGFKPMGLKGAALATTISEFVGEFIVLAIVIFDKKILLKPNLKDIFASKLSPYIETIKMGVPSALEGFAWNIGNLMLIVILNHVSEVAAGVYTIIFSIECLPIVAIGALGSATLTLCGQETGRENYPMIRTIVRTAVFWCFGLASFILIMFISFPTVIMGWFTSDKDIILAAVTYLAIVGVDLFPKSGNIIIGSAIKGYGDTKWMFGTQIFGTCFVISMASIMVFVLHLGMAELFCVVVADETIRASINYYKLRKISKKKKDSESSEVLIKPITCLN